MTAYGKSSPAIESVISTRDTETSAEMDEAPPPEKYHPTTLLRHFKRNKIPHKRYDIAEGERHHQLHTHITPTPRATKNSIHLYQQAESSPSPNRNESSSPPPFSPAMLPLEPLFFISHSFSSPLRIFQLSTEVGESAGSICRCYERML